MVTYVYISEFRVETDPPLRLLRNNNILVNTWKESAFLLTIFFKSCGLEEQKNIFFFNFAMKTQSFLPSELLRHKDCLKSRIKFVSYMGGITIGLNVALPDLPLVYQF